MKDIYAFFLDIDGTLCSGGKVPAVNTEAIEKARKLGHKFFIDTARSLGHIPPAVTALGLDGYVAGIGCTVVVEGKKILSENIPIGVIAELFDYFTDSGRKFMLEGEEITVVNKHFENPDSKYIFVESGKELIENFGSQVLAKAYIPHILSAEEQKNLDERFMFFQHPDYAEFSKKGFSKATGMQKVLDYYGIDRSHCVAMGDSANDLDMLRYAGISVAMGNSSKEVKDSCDIVTCDDDKGGVSEGIIRILGNIFP